MATASANSNRSNANYQIPAIDGKMYQALPIKFCLKFKPPTIAVVYQFLKGKQKKYIHEIRVDMKENCDIQKIVEDLCKKESIYLNTDQVSKGQVSLLKSTKLPIDTRVGR
jgi:hypothetical protein